MASHHPGRIIILALSAAIAFVVLRVIYRVIFGGAGSGETLLWSWPQVRLPGVFSHVVLLGPVSAEGITAAAQSALPFSAMIALTGSALAWWDPRAMLRSRLLMRAFSPIVSALALAMSTLPLAVNQVLRFRHTRLIRGERSRWIIFPAVFHTTLERAMGIAATMWMRGVWQTRQQRPSGVDVLTMQSVRIGERPVAEITWTIRNAGWHVLTGPTGSGKTTLLETIAGLTDGFHDEVVQGTITTAAGERIGLLPHYPHSIFLRRRFYDDLVQTIRENSDVPITTQEAASVAMEMVDDAGIRHLCQRDVATLSTGEATMAALLVLLATSPQLLLLDEPLGALDAPSATRFIRIVSTFLQETGATALISDHRHSQILTGVGTVWQLTKDGISEGPWQPSTTASPITATRCSEQDVVCEVSELTATRGHNRVLDGVSFTVCRGETIVITGDNGSGKTTLLHSLVFPEKPSQVVCSGVDIASVAPRHRSSIIASVPSDPVDFFLYDTAGRELEEADRRYNVSTGSARLTWRSLLSEIDDEEFSRLTSTHPRDLSRGQATTLAIAIQLVAKPLVIVIDEPTRGLDEHARNATKHTLDCVTETGTAVVLTTHDSDVMRWDVSATWHLSGGRLRAPEEVSA